MMRARRRVFRTDLDARRAVMKVYNKELHHFAADRSPKEALRAFNDYLEQVENLIVDLVEGDEATKQRRLDEMAAYEQQHQQQIMHTMARSMWGGSAAKCDGDTVVPRQLQRALHLPDVEGWSADDAEARWAEHTFHVDRAAIRRAAISPRELAAGGYQSSWAWERAKAEAYGVVEETASISEQ
eukprot:Sspe_Gene.21206::Locus_7908_Transcript_1_1_Confidence_1.000_Length_590::g.21206::m.21206/K10842/MNAT1; CDK-activating kinase assembly factor MAT1